jgi:hypothetical protein
MTIDQDDYAQRPADDCLAGVSFKELKTIDQRKVCNSMILGRILRDRKWHRCHQLGCEFSELPHG